MSSINISSLSQSTGSTSLLNYLNNDDDDNSIMSTLITNKRAEFESTLSKYGYSTSSSSDNSAYTKMESSNEALLDAISKLSSDSLYTAADGEEYDNSSLLTSVNNFVTALQQLDFQPYKHRRCSLQPVLFQAAGYVHR